MSKTCPKCKKLDVAFAKSFKRSDGLQVYCKLCSKEMNAKRYQNGYKPIQMACNIQNREKIRDFILSVKTNNPCPCGEDDPACLDFHHVSDKVESISRMMSNTHGLDSVKEEIAKCCIVCANCHRKLHANSVLCWNLEKLVPVTLQA